MLIKCTMLQRKWLNGTFDFQHSDSPKLAVLMSHVTVSEYIPKFIFMKQTQGFGTPFERCFTI